MEFYAGNIIRLGVLLFLLCGALGATIKGEDGAERDSAQGLKRILDTAFDKLSIELARGYIIRKHARFPNQIKTVDDLEAYLHRLYPNEGHELRQALLRLRLYKKSFDGDGGTIRDFMKNGLGLYAVNLDGRPMAYDRAKVEAIISEAVVQANQLKLGAMGNRTDKAAKEIKKLGATPGGANNFINRNSPLVMGLFVAAGLGLCCWLFIKRMGKKPESNSPEPDAADKGAHTGVASPAPEYKALPEEETVIVSGQGSESLPEIVAAAAVAAPPAPDTESETRSPPTMGRAVASGWS